jgi:hypothetical protein
MRKEPRLLRVGVLGCGPISQFAHLEACRKARNAELYAICDVADDLVEKMAAIHWHEEFQVYGEYGSVIGKTYNPWYLKSSDVECFFTRDGQYHRPLGEDASRPGGVGGRGKCCFSPRQACERSLF